MKFELTKEFINDIKERLEQKDFKVLKSELSQLHHVDIAALIEELGEEQGKTLFELFEDQDSAEILIELDDENREVVLEDLTSQEIAEELIENLDSDDAADIISDLSTAKKVEVLSHIEDIEHASDIVDLLSYPENTAGGLMAKELIQVNDKWSVLRCVKEMRKQAEDVDKVYTIYVVNDHNILLGTLSLKKLLLTSEKTYIKNVYNEKVISVKADFDDEEVANIMDKYDLVVLPVVDDLNRLIGRITIDDIVDVIKEEAMEDYNKASGISEQVYSSDDIITLTRARLPWLLIGLMGGIMGAQVMGIFDIQNNIELAFFTPLIAAMGGNVGVQSAAIIVQGLASNSLGMDTMGERLLKELGVAMLNGIICSVLIMLITFLLGYPSSIYFTVSISLMAVIIFAALFGTFVPLALNKYKIDPALATGPFITTVNDVLGLFIYFMIGKLFLEL
ncbi:MAG: magnesium transporter [Flavobacteriales bacterium]|tara:strand:+ start:468 stop:1817 length:1350 start_codon:yes stop_codon:yes gene_type:complete